MIHVIKSIYKAIKLLIEPIFLKSDDVAKYLTSRDFEIIDLIINNLRDNDFSINDDILKKNMKSMSLEYNDYKPMYFLSINDFHFLGRNPSNGAYKYLTAEGYRVSQIGSKAYFIESRKRNAISVMIEIIKFVIPVAISIIALVISINT